MHLNGLDAMRYLGADPSKPADDVEAMLMEKLNNRIVSEQKRLTADG
jgi:hypothetical protein